MNRCKYADSAESIRIRIRIYTKDVGKNTKIIIP